MRGDGAHPARRVDAERDVGEAEEMMVENGAERVRGIGTASSRRVDVFDSGGHPQPWLCSADSELGEAEARTRMKDGERVAKGIILLAGWEVVRAAVVAVAAFFVAVAVMRMEGAEVVESEAARRLLQRAGRAGYEPGGDGCACSSWDRYGCCMAVLPRSRRAGPRAIGGWSQRYTIVGCWRFGCDASMLHTLLRDGVVAAQACQQQMATTARRLHSTSRSGISHSFVQVMSVSLRIRSLLHAPAQQNTYMQTGNAGQKRE